MERISVAIITKYRLIGECMLAMIERHKNLTVLANASHVDAVSVARRKQPNVILLDADVPMGKDFRLLRDLANAASKAQLILLADEQSPEMHQAFLSHGVRGIVSKHELPQSLVKAIEKVHRGELWLERGATALAFRTLLRNREALAADKELETLSRLTARESEVASLVVEGLKNQEIADRLGLREATVRHHLTSIFSKCDVKDRVGLLRFVYEQGLLLPHGKPD